MNKKQNLKQNNPTTVYLISLVVSLLLVIASFWLKCKEIAGLILFKVGCSGIAASIMAIFLEISNQKREEKTIDENRYIFLYDLNYKFKQMFERVVWLVY